ncbi:putative zinc-type alcohol dehydrogenase-like protein PB24D3.08c [Annulohypoxylon moriforme]|nr:putative zinc-type alcohol dehydrogenase-like protein PB24D3.08c [Annulohypoxylon moriforme]
MHPNKVLIYKKYTPFSPIPGETLAVESRPFDPTAEPSPGGITVKNLYLSLDPYQRGQIRLPTDTGTYSVAWVEGEPAVVNTISKVLKSDNPRFKPDDLVLGFCPAGEYALIPAPLLAGSQVLPSTGLDIPLQTIIAVLGIPGLSAYVSFFEYVPEPREGKTMFVTAASGAVGQIVGQLAKMHGMRVIGSTGSAEKVDYVVNELGYDAAWNYKAERTAEALDRLAPEGIDVFYDNVGGEQLETALTKMKDFGRVVASGMVSQYNYPDQEKYGVRTLMNIVYKRLTVTGFICSDAHLLAKYMPQFVNDMVTWVSQGKIKTREEVVVGLDNAVNAWIDMLDGNKFGKMVLKIEDA